MKIVLGADHGGFELKEKIKTFLKDKYEVLDVGAFELDDQDDFSAYVKLIRHEFDNDNSVKIVACCGTGVGVSIGLNKHKGIFCMVGSDKSLVKMGREHNNINAITFGGRVNDYKQVIEMLEIFLNTKFIGGKYERRMLDIDID